jgi:hypothetical protein
VILHSLLAGALATALMTIMLRASVELHVSRMDFPFILGTMLTADRDRAKLLGMGLNFLMGLAFSLFYAAFFRDFAPPSARLGALLGLAHGLFVLVILMPLAPTVHPRMATPSRGPDATPMLEPPGFLALNYGRRTPAISLLAHVLYGAILGALL